MARGSKHMTMSAISHLTAFSLSVSTPRRSGTYRIGAASVSILRPRAATRARSAFRAARVPASRFRASASSPRILRWPSIADRAVLVFQHGPAISQVDQSAGSGIAVFTLVRNAAFVNDLPNTKPTRSLILTGASARSIPRSRRLRSVGGPNRGFAVSADPHGSTHRHRGPVRSRISCS
jgi:hypothetical protein